ncbi:MAG: type VI secretion system contractile sheath large subunit, partial [Planctomycetes bacterium]|nr:type VI secretion system contractile sheath large subunit [Planctomycetota bacterium]
MSSDPQQQAAAAAATTTSAGPSILDQVIKATRPQDQAEADRVKDYFKQFLDRVVQPGQVVSKDVEKNIKHWISQIDQRLSAQLNEVIHHPDYQKLEGTWRGLKYLVSNSETGENLKIKVLNVNKKDLLKDLEKASEFDQSALFKKVYEEEYGQLGGQPYGMLVGDYEFGRTAEDISLLKFTSQVAAASHAPFVAAASPKMFNLDSFTELSQPRDLAKIFDSVEYASWKSFRESEDSRYVSLTMPRVLARLPYGAKSSPVEEFNFEENVDGKDHDKYQWMSSAWAYATRVTDAFAKDGWFMRTRG